MRLIETYIDDLLILKSDQFVDDRGSFSRVYCQEELLKLTDQKIAQINISNTSKKGTLRGLHIQKKPFHEIKIIQCIKGSVYDVALDMRKESKTFLKSNGIKLSSKDNLAYFIPAGFAHGFQALEDDCSLLYFHTNFYSKNHESGFLYNDSAFDINWPLNPINLSNRDQSFNPITNNFKGYKI